MEIQEKERVPGVQGELACSRRKGSYSTGEERLGPCQVRSRTDRPCPYPAAVEIQGVPFCEQCAREQRRYFEIGDLTRALETRGVREQRSPRGSRNGPLGEMPEGALRELVGRIVRAREREREEHEDGSPLSETAGASAALPEIKPGPERLRKSDSGPAGCYREAG